MFRLISFSALFVSLLVGFLYANEHGSPIDEEDRKALWAAVADAQGKRLPQTAIKNLKSIYDSAVTDEAWPEASFALCSRLLMEGQINQPIHPYVIKQLQSAIPESPEPMKPVLKMMLAEYFFLYFQENRWRFQQRSQSSGTPGDDFETWDLATILNEIDKQFKEALAEKDTLRKIPIETYDRLLEAGTVSDKHRPTLYDFIAFRAIGFYSLDEQFIRQQSAFEISADSPIFASTKEFLNWKPETTDDDSYTLRAIQLLQEVLQFHIDDADQTAFLDADLSRLLFGISAAKGEESGSRYRAALQRFSDTHLDHPLSSGALGLLAASVQADENDLVKAKQIAEQGKARFPDSIGANQCRNIIESIESKSAAVTTERVWNGDDVRVKIQYKNIDKVFFRLVKFDHKNWTRWGQYRRVQNLNDLQIRAFTKQAAAKQWSVDLPATDDFKARTESVKIDKDKYELQSGCYILLCSTEDSFEMKKGDSDFKAVKLTEVWVSNLAVLLRKSTSNGAEFEVQVLDALSGKPLEGASVQRKTWKYNGRKSAEQRLEAVATNAAGIAAFTKNNMLTKLDVTHGDQTLGLIENVHSNRQRPAYDNSRTIIFTDRSIYRPGQTIQFKGIHYRANSKRNRYTTQPDTKISVRFRDVNRQEIEFKEFHTNEFGSFSGSFTAPRNRAMGSMTLESRGGNARIRVEEYKRPRFFTEIEKPNEAFQLGQKVTVSGKATAYTGAAIDGSKVVWRVVRSVRYPRWWQSRYWYIPGRSEQQEIANGETTTKDNGSFEIEFTAEPDKSVARESEPIFRYQIFADVTDTAGETRSASQTTSVGYTSLKADLSTGVWANTEQEIEFKLDVTTLDGEGQESKGTLKLFELTPPEKVQRAQLGNRWQYNRGNETTPDLSRINAWPTGAVVLEQDLATDASGKAIAKVTLKAGAFKAVFETTDPAGNKVRSEETVLVSDLKSDNFAVKVPEFFTTKDKSVQPGEDFVALWGTGYDTGSAFVELEHRGNVFQSYWTDPNVTQHLIKFPIEEKHRGGVQLRITFVRDNRLYSKQHGINVPWSNKKLSVKWEHFISKLQPGSRETWTAVVSGPDAENVVGEMVAGMYDASLDAFSPHRWIDGFNAFFRNSSLVSIKFHNFQQSARSAFQYSGTDYFDVNRTYRRFRDQTGIYTQLNEWHKNGRASRTLMGGAFAFSKNRSRSGRTPGDQLELASEGASTFNTDAAPGSATRRKNGRPGPSTSGIDLKQVSPRKNLQETAFFFPHLKISDDGTVRVEFEIPEALTKWKFMGFAHDNDLRSVLLTDEMTTSKDLMVQPNPPRFLREGDLLEFSVKVSNQSDDPQTGTVQLTFANARNAQSVDAAFGNQQLEQTFAVPARQSKSLYWKIKVPDFVGALTYKAVGATEKISDGEEGILPVLSKRILVTESLPLPIRGNQTKTFDFERLKLAAQSDTLQSQTLTVQMTSNPSWYAVLSLPYLMEYPHACSEQTFNRLYANSIGHHIVSSDPKIERIFEQWRGTDALDSPLEKNDELRNVIIAESPWLETGKKESQARRNVGILFDKNRMTTEIKQALDRLSQMQLSDGAWPWFPGGRANDYITLYVTTGFGRLRQLGATTNVRPALRAIDRLDWWLKQKHEAIKRRGDLEKNNLSNTVCLYMYGRSFFLKDKPVNDQYKAAFDYFVDQSKKHWASLGNRQSQGHLAIALKRLGDGATPAAIIASLTERSQQDDELGMYWREGDRSWWWYRAPIETQALMIEVYDEVARDSAKVEELKIWLLKQKQTRNWKTTKATADACYGLLLRGTNLLASDKLVQVKLGSTEIKPEKVEAGTGFYEQKFVRGEIKPEMGQIEMVKSDEGIAWGSIHWQYLEDVSKIEPFEGTPLTLKKSLYTKKNTEKGPVISKVDGPVEVGDELLMRVELRVDRAMEYVHLKDYRGSGTEPVSVLSRYRYQDGLAYYESTKDTASHFFIDYLPRGTYVFEYSVRVQHRGVYETGIAELQCMYAPEFNSHSGSVEIKVE